MWSTHVHIWKKRIWWGQTSYMSDPWTAFCFELISYQQGIRNSLSSTPPVYIHARCTRTLVVQQFRTNEIHPPHHYLHSACHAQSNKLGKASYSKTTSHGLGHGNEATKDTYTHWGTSTWKKTYLVGPDKLYERSLDSAVSSLLALISREFTYIRIYVHVCTLTCLSELLHASGFPCVFGEVCFLSEFC